MILLLSVALCLVVTTPLLAETNWGWTTLQEYEETTGNKIEKFSEAPMLKEMVTAGEIPSLEQRLPEEPLVDKPFEEVGTYGGTLRLGMLAASVWYPAALHTVEYMLTLDRKGEEVVPNIAKGWEFSDEGKTFTLYLRKGMRWSDGVPFTADDILFYWESVVLNDEITPVKPAAWMPGGELPIVEKVDDYTVSFHFSRAYWTIIYRLSGVYFQGNQNWCFLPKHALKKYHIDYNPEADELAQEKEYDHWWELFNEKRWFWIDKQPNLDIPSVGPWVAKKISPEGVVYERNPYYFKVDTAGNQLPYVDTVKATIFGDTTTLTLKMATGEYDYQDWATGIKDYPVFMEGEEQGGYYVWLAKNLWSSDVAVLINQNYNEDPLIGDILKDVRFRRALSLAINREEVNEVAALGKGVPCQATVHPSSSFYQERWARTYAEYDPERANRILDEMGLNEKDKDGYRLGLDGKTLLLVVTMSTDIPACVGSSELIKEYWEDVGIKTSINPVDRGYLYTLYAASTYMVSLWVFDAVEAVLSTHSTFWFEGMWWATQWQTWWTSNGEGGEEPPEQAKRMFSLYDEVPFLPQEEKMAALTEICDIWAENLWEIGVIGMVPKPAVTSVELGNVNTHTYTDNASVGCGTFNRIYQLFWKK